MTLVLRWKLLEGKGCLVMLFIYEKRRRRTTTMEGAEEIGFVFLVEEDT